MKTYEYVTLPRPSRTHVTLRIPEEVASAVEGFARTNQISKTDAYVHFLQIGLASEQSERQQTDNGAIQAKLDKILELLGNEQ